MEENLEEIDALRIRFSETSTFDGKKIKGAITINEFKYENVVFHKCVFDSPIKFKSNLNKKIFSFSFIKCTIQQVYIECFVDTLTFDDCKISAIYQREGGETNNLGIICDENKKNSIENLILLNSKTNQLFLRDYRINTISLRNFHIEKSLDIRNIDVFQKFDIIDCNIKFGSVITSGFHDDFCIKELHSGSDLYFDTINCKHVRIYSSLRNVNLIFRTIEAQSLRFQNLEVINSNFKLDTVTVSDNLCLLDSDFNDTVFADCNFSNCKIEISFPILRNIKSTNLYFSDNVQFYHQNRNETIEKQYSEKIEFYRQLKINSIEQNNQFDALKYYSKEMDWYLKSMRNLPELSSILRIKNRLFKSVIIWLFQWIYDFFDLVIHTILKWRNPSEKFRLWLFKYTNNFGIEWFKPAIIYLIISYGFFTFASGSYNFTINFRFDAFFDPNFIRFLNPIHKLSLFDLSIEHTSKTAWFEFFAIIIQGFLIYQIIRGFRKFSFKP